MRRGFTLIELLGVIVILSILSLIAIPKISKNIEDLRINSVTSSVYGLMNAANNYYVKNDLSGDIIFKCDGKSCKNNRGGKLKIDGEIPISGEIIKHIDSIEVVDIKLRGYCAVGNRTKLNVSTDCIDVLKPTLSLAIGKRETNSLTFGISAMSPDKIKKITYEFYGKKVIKETNSNNINTTKVYTNLNENKSYTLKVSIEDETGKMVEKEINAKTDTLGNIKFSVNLIKDKYKNQTLNVGSTISFTYNGKTHANGYYVMTEENAEADIYGTPQGKNILFRTKKLKANTWYHFTSIPKITYKKPIDINSFIYVYPTDAKNATATAKNIINKTSSYLIPKNKLIPGFYNNNYEIIASWEDMENKYHFDAEYDYKYKVVGDGAFEMKASILGTNTNRSFNTIMNSDLNDLKNTRIIIMPDELKKIGNYAFYGINQLNSLKFTNNIESIGEKAFGTVSLLSDSNIILPKKLVSIGGSMISPLFIESVTFPKTFKEFNYNKSSTGYLENCFGHSVPKKIIVDKSNPYFKDVDEKALVTKDGKKLILSAKYIPTGVVEIGDAAFAGQSFDNIQLPNNLLKIGNSAFADNSSLRSITIPDSVTEIGEKAFYKTKLGSFNIPKKLKVISKDMFSQQGTNGMKDGKCSYGEFDLTIPEGVTKIDDNAFWGLCSLKSVKLPNSLTHIGKYSFKGTQLSSITLPNGIKTIDNNAFGSTNIKIINLPDSVEHIPEDMVYSSNEFEYATYKGKKYVCGEIPPNIVGSYCKLVLSK